MPTEPLAVQPLDSGFGVENGEGKMGGCEDR